jgi:hypothetical protein
MSLLVGLFAGLAVIRLGDINRVYAAEKQSFRQLLRENREARAQVDTVDARCAEFRCPFQSDHPWELANEQNILLCLFHDTLRSTIMFFSISQGCQYISLTQNNDDEMLIGADLRLSEHSLLPIQQRICTLCNTGVSNISDDGSHVTGKSLLTGYDEMDRALLAPVANNVTLAHLNALADRINASQNLLTLLSNDIDDGFGPDLRVTQYALNQGIAKEEDQSARGRSLCLFVWMISKCFLHGSLTPLDHMNSFPGSSTWSGIGMNVRIMRALLRLWNFSAHGLTVTDQDLI